MQETRLWSLDWKEPLEKEMAIHSSILAWRIPWTVHGVAKSWTERPTLSLYVFIFSSVACVFGIISKQPLPNLMSWRLPPTFSLKTFFTLVLTFTPLIHFCTQCKVRVQLYSFARACPIFLPRTLWKLKSSLTLDSLWWGPGISNPKVLRWCPRASQAESHRPTALLGPS